MLCLFSGIVRFAGLSVTTDYNLNAITLDDRAFWNVMDLIIYYCVGLVFIAVKCHGESAIGDLYRCAEFALVEEGGDFIANLFTT